jgi:hypothetical protein
MTLKSSQEGRLKFLVRFPITYAIFFFFINLVTLRAQEIACRIFFLLALTSAPSLPSLSASAFLAFQSPLIRAGPRLPPTWD